MENIFKNRIFGILSVIFIGISLVSCSGSSTKNDMVPEEVLEPVRTSTIAEKEIARVLEYPATLKGWDAVDLAPATPGRIESFNVEVGDYVKKGDVLLTMDRTQLSQIELQLANFEKEFERAKILHEAGSFSAQAYDQLKTQFEVAKTNFDYLKTNTMLRAPFSGVISGKYFEAGEVYSGTPIQSIGKAAVLSIVMIDDLKAIISLPESYFPEVNKNLAVNVKSDIYKDKVFKGKVDIVYPIVNPSTRTFDVEIKVYNRGKKLRPGMFTRVNIDLGTEKAVLIPDYSVLKMQGSNERYLFVVEDGKAKRIVVKIGTRFNDEVEVLSDELRTGMQLIVEGQGRLVNGAKVNVIK